MQIDNLENELISIRWQQVSCDCVYEVVAQHWLSPQESAWGRGP